MMFDTSALWKLLPNYSGVTPLMFSMYLLAGVFGALVRVAWLNKPLRGFYREPGEKGLRMGFFAEVVTAVGVAVAIDGHPIRAGIASVFAPWILQAVKDTIIVKIPAILRATIKSALNDSEQK
jgi:hypothetical protein